MSIYKNAKCSFYKKQNLEIDVLKIEAESFENDKSTITTHNFDLLPKDVDYVTGTWKNRDNSWRRERLKIASPNVWSVGWYLPSRLSYAKDDALTQQILANKDGDHGVFLAMAMYATAKEKKFNIFDTDIIIPVPNFKTDFNAYNSRAESIARYLCGIMKKHGHEKVELGNNILDKTINISTKTMSPDEKDSFFKENDVYAIKKESNIQGKKILLIDDVITTGYTAGQCLQTLQENGATDLCFYTVCNTKPR